MVLVSDFVVEPLLEHDETFGPEVVENSLSDCQGDAGSEGTDWALDPVGLGVQWDSEIVLAEGVEEHIDNTKYDLMPPVLWAKDHVGKDDLNSCLDNWNDVEGGLMHGHVDVIRLVHIKWWEHKWSEKNPEEDGDDEVHGGCALVGNTGKVLPFCKLNSLVGSKECDGTAKVAPEGVESDDPDHMISSQGCNETDARWDKHQQSDYD